MKLDRKKLKMPHAKIDPSLIKIINKLKSVDDDELLSELQKMNTWNYEKTELNHWIDVLDRFDAILEHASNEPKFSTWLIHCDLPQNEKEKELVIHILVFTTNLIEHTTSRSSYNSIHHLVNLLKSSDLTLVIAVLNLLYVFSKRSNFISKLPQTRKLTLLKPVLHLAESWGGKANGYSLAKCCLDIPITDFPTTATSLHFEFYPKPKKIQPPNFGTQEPNYDASAINVPVPTKTDKVSTARHSSLSKEPGTSSLITIHVDNVDKLIGKQPLPSHVMHDLFKRFDIPEDKKIQLFSQVRLAFYFSNYEKRILCIFARLRAISILLYSKSFRDKMDTYVYPSLIEELMEILQLKDPKLLEIQTAALRTLTALVHSNSSNSTIINSLVNATELSTYGGLLPTLLRDCIKSQILMGPSLAQAAKGSTQTGGQLSLVSNSTDPVTSYGIALFSFVYHMANVHEGSEAILASGLLKDFLRVVSDSSDASIQIIFETRAVRIIDMVSSVDMQAFFNDNGPQILVARFQREIDVCIREQPFMLPHECPVRNQDTTSFGTEEPSTSMAVAAGAMDFEEHPITGTGAGSGHVPHKPLDREARAKHPCILATAEKPKPGVKCYHPRAALLKSILNLLKNIVSEPAHINQYGRQMMNPTFIGYLKHIISNVEYYGHSLFLLALDLVSNYIFSEPSELSSIQKSGMTTLMLKALLDKEVPATREIMTSLPTIFTSLCLNHQGMQDFVACKPFDRLFGILISPKYLPALKAGKRHTTFKSEPAQDFGAMIDELLRHQPSLKQDAMAAICNIISELISMGERYPLDGLIEDPTTNAAPTASITTLTVTSNTPPASLAPLNASAQAQAKANHNEPSPAAANSQAETRVPFIGQSEVENAGQLDAASMRSARPQTSPVPNISHEEASNGSTSLTLFCGGLSLLSSSSSSSSEEDEDGYATPTALRNGHALVNSNPILNPPPGVPVRGDTLGSSEHKSAPESGLNSPSVTQFLEYMYNVLKFLEAIIGNGFSNDHCQAFVNQGGNDKLLKLPSLPILPLNFVHTNAFKALVSVYKWIVTYSHYPTLINLCLKTIMASMEALDLTPPVSDSMPSSKQKLERGFVNHKITHRKLCYISHITTLIALIRSMNKITKVEVKRFIVQYWTSSLGKMVLAKLNHLSLCLLFESQKQQSLLAKAGADQTGFETTQSLDPDTMDETSTSSAPPQTTTSSSSSTTINTTLASLCISLNEAVISLFSSLMEVCGSSTFSGNSNATASGILRSSRNTIVNRNPLYGSSALDGPGTNSDSAPLSSIIDSAAGAISQNFKTVLTMYKHGTIETRSRCVPYFLQFLRQMCRTLLNDKKSPNLLALRKFVASKTFAYFFLALKFMINGGGDKPWASSQGTRIKSEDKAGPNKSYDIYEEVFLDFWVFITNPDIIFDAPSSGSSSSSNPNPLLGPPFGTADQQKQQLEAIHYARYIYGYSVKLLNDLLGPHTTANDVFEPSECRDPKKPNNAMDSDAQARTQAILPRFEPFVVETLSSVIINIVEGQAVIKSRSSTTIPLLKTTRASSSQPTDATSAGEISNADPTLLPSGAALDAPTPDSNLTAAAEDRSAVTPASEAPPVQALLSDQEPGPEIGSDYTTLSPETGLISALVDMGFPRERVLEAVQHSSTLEQATEYLLSMAAVAAEEEEADALDAIYRSPNDDAAATLDANALPALATLTALASPASELAEPSDTTTNTMVVEEARMMRDIFQSLEQTQEALQRASDMASAFQQTHLSSSSATAPSPQSLSVIAPASTTSFLPDAHPNFPSFTFDDAPDSVASTIQERHGAAAPPTFTRLERDLFSDSDPRFIPETDAEGIVFENSLQTLLEPFLPRFLQFLEMAPGSVPLLSNLFSALAKYNGPQWLQTSLTSILTMVDESLKKFTADTKSERESKELKVNQRLRTSTLFQLCSFVFEEFNESNLALFDTTCLCALLTSFLKSWLSTNSPATITKEESNQNQSSPPEWLLPCLLLLDQSAKVAGRAGWTSFLSTLSPPVKRSWKWHDNYTGKWGPYSAAVNETVDKAFAENRVSARFATGPRRYRIDFWPMTQTNEETRNRRPVKLELNFGSASQQQQQTRPIAPKDRASTSSAPAGSDKNFKESSPSSSMDVEQNGAVKKVAGPEKGEEILNVTESGLPLYPTQCQGLPRPVVNDILSIVTSLLSQSGPVSPEILEALLLLCVRFTRDRFACSHFLDLNGPVLALQCATTSCSYYKGTTDFKGENDSQKGLAHKVHTESILILSREIRMLITMVFRHLFEDESTLKLAMEKVIQGSFSHLAIPRQLETSNHQVSAMSPREFHSLIRVLGPALWRDSSVFYRIATEYFILTPTPTAQAKNEYPELTVNSPQLIKLSPKYAATAAAEHGPGKGEKKRATSILYYLLHKLKVNFQLRHHDAPATQNYALASRLIAEEQQVSARDKFAYYKAQSNVLLLLAELCYSYPYVSPYLIEFVYEQSPPQMIKSLPPNWKDNLAGTTFLSFLLRRLLRYDYYYLNLQIGAMGAPAEETAGPLAKSNELYVAVRSLLTALTVCGAESKELREILVGEVQAALGPATHSHYTNLFNECKEFGASYKSSSKGHSTPGAPTTASTLPGNDLAGARMTRDLVSVLVDASIALSRYRNATTATKMTDDATYWGGAGVNAQHQQLQQHQAYLQQLMLMMQLSAGVSGNVALSGNAAADACSGAAPQYALPKSAHKHGLLRELARIPRRLRMDDSSFVSTVSLVLQTMEALIRLLNFVPSSTSPPSNLHANADDRPINKGINAPTSAPTSVSATSFNIPTTVSTGASHAATPTPAADASDLNTPNQQMDSVQPSSEDSLAAQQNATHDTGATVRRRRRHERQERDTLDAFDAFDSALRRRGARHGDTEARRQARRRRALGQRRRDADAHDAANEDAIDEDDDSIALHDIVIVRRTEEEDESRDEGDHVGDDHVTDVAMGDEDDDDVIDYDDEEEDEDEDDEEEEEDEIQDGDDGEDNATLYGVDENEDEEEEDDDDDEMHLNRRDVDARDALPDDVNVTLPLEGDEDIGDDYDIDDFILADDDEALADDEHRAGPSVATRHGGASSFGRSQRRLSAVGRQRRRAFYQNRFTNRYPLFGSGSAGAESSRSIGTGGAESGSVFHRQPPIIIRDTRNTGSRQLSDNWANVVDLNFLQSLLDADFDLVNTRGANSTVPSTGIFGTFSANIFSGSLNNHDAGPSSGATSSDAVSSIVAAAAGAAAADRPIITSARRYVPTFLTHAAGAGARASAASAAFPVISLDEYLMGAEDEYDTPVPLSAAASTLAARPGAVNRISLIFNAANTLGASEIDDGVSLASGARRRRAATVNRPGTSGLRVVTSGGSVSAAAPALGSSVGASTLLESCQRPYLLRRMFALYRSSLGLEHFAMETAPNTADQGSASTQINQDQRTSVFTDPLVAQATLLATPTDAARHTYQLPSTLKRWSEEAILLEGPYIQNQIAYYKHCIFEKLRSNYEAERKIAEAAKKKAKELQEQELESQQKEKAKVAGGQTVKSKGVATKRKPFKESSSSSSSGSSSESEIAPDPLGPPKPPSENELRNDHDPQVPSSSENDTNSTQNTAMETSETLPSDLPMVASPISEIAEEAIATTSAITLAPDQSDSTPVDEVMEVESANVAVAPPKNEIAVLPNSTLLPEEPRPYLLPEGESPSGSVPQAIIPAALEPEYKIVLGEGLDPSFLTALPENLRQEVMSEQIRLQHIELNNRRNANRPSGSASASTAAAASTSLEPIRVEICPEFLAALPANIQTEILTQQRTEQERQNSIAARNRERAAALALSATSSAGSGPAVSTSLSAAAGPALAGGDSFDPGVFIHTLPFHLRQQVLSDIDESMLAVLPPDMAEEARTLQRHIEVRHRRLQQSLFGGQWYRLTATSANGGLQSGLTAGGTSSRRTQNQGGAAGGRQNSSSTHSSGAVLSRGGKRLLDYESLGCLIVLTLSKVEHPKMTRKVCEILRELSRHPATFAWIFEALLSLLEAPTFLFAQHSSDPGLSEDSDQLTLCELDGTVTAYMGNSARSPATTTTTLFNQDPRRAKQGVNPRSSKQQSNSSGSRPSSGSFQVASCRWLTLTLKTGLGSATRVFKSYTVHLVRKKRDAVTKSRILDVSAPRSGHDLTYTMAYPKPASASTTSKTDSTDHDFSTSVTIPLIYPHPRAIRMVTKTVLDVLLLLCTDTLPLHLNASRAAHHNKDAGASNGANASWETTSPSAPPPTIWDSIYKLDSGHNVEPLNALPTYQQLTPTSSTFCSGASAFPYPPIAALFPDDGADVAPIAAALLPTPRFPFPRSLVPVPTLNAQSVAAQPSQKTPVSGYQHISSDGNIANPFSPHKSKQSKLTTTGSPSHYHFKLIPEYLALNALFRLLRLGADQLAIRSDKELADQLLHLTSFIANALVTYNQARLFPWCEVLDKITTQLGGKSVVNSHEFQQQPNTQRVEIDMNLLERSLRDFLNQLVGHLRPQDPTTTSQATTAGGMCTEKGLDHLNKTLMSMSKLILTFRVTKDLPVDITFGPMVFRVLLGVVREVGLQLKRDIEAFTHKLETHLNRDKEIILKAVGEESKEFNEESVIATFDKGNDDSNAPTTVFESLNLAPKTPTTDPESLQLFNDKRSFPSQHLFLRMLKTLKQIHTYLKMKRQQATTTTATKTSEEEPDNSVCKSISHVVAPATSASESSASSDAIKSPSSEESQILDVSLAKLVGLEPLWDALSYCLLQLERVSLPAPATLQTPLSLTAPPPPPQPLAAQQTQPQPQTLTLLLQPTVEAFFLVHTHHHTNINTQNAAHRPTYASVVNGVTGLTSDHSYPATAEMDQLASSPGVPPTSTQGLGAGSDGNDVGTSGVSSSNILSTHEPLTDEIKRFLNFATSHRQVLNQILRQQHGGPQSNLRYGPFSILASNYAHLLDFDIKRRYFREVLERLPATANGNNTTDNFHHHHRTGEDFPVHVRRNQVFEDSYRELHRQPSSVWKSRFYIIFEGEEGQDAGGLLREWYSIIAREIFNPNYALFRTSPGDRVTYTINPASHCNSNHLSYFKFVGRVIAKAIYDNKHLECYFTRSFYKHILGKNVKYSDMESEDYEFYQGLVYLLENNLETLGYDLSFSTQIQEFGVTETRDLIPNGQHTLVTEENKQEYVALLCQMKMTGAIRQQLNSFLEGFYDVIPKHLISIFNEQELELFISGLPNFDIEDLRTNTEYHKYMPDSLQIKWFWRALRSFDQATKAKFLQFVTGTSKVPLQGFASLEGMNGIQKFQIYRDNRSTDRLPSAHTCFNQLDLPAYETYEKLHSMLLKAILECSEGFGLA